MQHLDTVGWMTGRPAGLYKSHTSRLQSTKVLLWKTFGQTCVVVVVVVVVVYLLLFIIAREYYFRLELQQHICTQLTMLQGAQHRENSLVHGSQQMSL